MLLSLLKVFGVSLLSYGLVQLYFVADPSARGADGQGDTLAQFALIYGSIPTSSSPLVFSQAYKIDPMIIALATLLCLVISFPTIIVIVTLVYDTTLDGLKIISPVLHISSAALSVLMRARRLTKLCRASYNA